MCVYPWSPLCNTWQITLSHVHMAHLNWLVNGRLITLPWHNHIIHSTRHNETFLRMSWVRLYLSHNGVVDHLAALRILSGATMHVDAEFWPWRPLGLWKPRCMMGCHWDPGKNMRNFNGVIISKDEALWSSRAGRLLMMSCVKDELYLLLCIV